MTKILPLMFLAAVLAGCAVQPVEPVAVLEPAVLEVCDPIEPVAPCVDQGFGYYYAPPTVGVVGWYPIAPVGFVAPVGINVGVGFGGGTVVNHAVVNNFGHAGLPVVASAGPRASFAQGHPGFISAMHVVGHAAAVGARVAVKSAAVAGRAGAPAHGRPPIR